MEDAGADAYSPPMGTADYPAETEQNNLKQSANPLAAGAKGFTAGIWPTGDVDVFSVDVAVAGSSLRIETSDGMGGCPIGCATYVRVFGGSGLLASETNSGMGSCTLLDPAQVPPLSGLPVGTYFVQIESATLDAIPFYVVDLQLSAPACGDGIVQVEASEQCDDGNMSAGDGCSASCTIEGDFIPEVEPNDTSVQATQLGSHAGAVGAINPAGDADYYSFDVAVAGSSVTAFIDNGFGTCPGFDSKLYLYDGGDNLVVSNDDGAMAPCSSISPLTDPEATNLPAGKYTVKVTHYNASKTQGSYVLHTAIVAPGCGDAIVQAGEQCDDGNTAAGDGCSPTCQLEGNFTQEAEPNDTQGLANALGGADGFAGAISPVGDLDYFSFEVSVPGSSVTIVVDDGAGKCPGFDSKITLFNPAAQAIATDDDGGDAPCSAIRPAVYAAAKNLPVGTYKVRVQEANGLALQAAYVVHIKVSAPGCGDGIVDAGEQCDDGNTSSGDGCSATCMAEAPWEIEPNDSTMTATPLWPGTTMWRGAINPTGDHDYFSFTLNAMGSVTLATHDVGNAATCGFDTVIYLLDPNGAQLVKNDDGGVSSCSKIDPVADPGAKNLAPGTYYVWVQRYNDSQSISGYELSIAIQ